MHCLWVQKMTVLSVNDYCNGDRGAQPASSNPSLETKETKAGPLWDDCSSRWAPVRSGLKHSPCNWAFTHNAAWKLFFFSFFIWCYSFEWTCSLDQSWEVYFHRGDCWSHIVICSSVHVHGRFLKEDLACSSTWRRSPLIFFFYWTSIAKSCFLFVDRDRKCAKQYRYPYSCWCF